MSVVFDSSAILAITFAEQGAEVATRFLHEGLISAVNVSEVITRYVDMGVNEEEARASLSLLGLQICPFDEAMAIAAGLMRKTTQNTGLSLGDRACLALAIREQTRVITADRAWTTLELGIEVKLIR